VILFHPIVQIFALPELTARRERSLLPKGLEGGRTRGLLVHGDYIGSERM
jgi:hypothetical protein